KRGIEASRRAVELWAPLQQPQRALFATVVWVRQFYTHDPELDRACAELRERAAALPDLTPMQQLQVQGALSNADLARNDHAAELIGRLREVELARAVGNINAMEAAESNVVNVLNVLGRSAEAAERGRALLARVDPDSSGLSGNLPWVLSALVMALVRTGARDEARTLVARAYAAGRRFLAPTTSASVVELPLREKRLDVAARLIGYARTFHAECGELIDPGDEAVLRDITREIARDLGEARTAALIEEGRA